MTRAAPWSFSKLKAFDTCPKQFYHEKVLKEYPFAHPGPFLARTEFHKACENYIGDEEPLPKKFIYVKNALDALNDKRGVKLCEKKLGITADLEPCGFYDKRVWFRGIADLLIIDVVGNMAWVVDYKTGKSAKYADKGQLELMALSVFAHYPDIDRVKAGLFFVVAGDLVKDTYKTLDKVSLWKKGMTNYARMETAFEADVWNPRPSGLCRRHCQVTECPHNGSN